MSAQGAIKAHTDALRIFSGAYFKDKLFVLYGMWCPLFHRLVVSTSCLIVVLCTFQWLAIRMVFRSLRAATPADRLKLLPGSLLVAVLGSCS